MGWKIGSTAAARAVRRRFEEILEAECRGVVAGAAAFPPFGAGRACRRSL